MRVANIVGFDNMAGLSRDIDVLAAALTAHGWDVRYNGRVTRGAPRGEWERAHWWLRRISRELLANVLRRTRYDVNVFLENIPPEFLPLARLNVLVPNPEFFRPSSEPHLSRIDLVLAKTKDASRVFGELGCRVGYMGFTSLDRSLHSRAGHKEHEALHIAGRSAFKGTEVILDAWTKHPEWPQLTVVRSPTDYDGTPFRWRPRSIPANVTMIEGHLPDQDLRSLQNSKLFHVATSEAEGFGHCIAEAMSVGAVVVTTDAPPMNELVTAETGILVATADRTTRGRGWRFTVDQDDFERKMNALFELDPRSLDELGHLARSAYELKATEFASNFSECLNTILGHQAL